MSYDNPCGLRIGLVVKCSLLSRQWVNCCGACTSHLLTTINGDTVALLEPRGSDSCIEGAIEIY